MMQFRLSFHPPLGKGEPHALILMMKFVTSPHQQHDRRYPEQSIGGRFFCGLFSHPHDILKQDVQNFMRPLNRQEAQLLYQGKPQLATEDQRYQADNNEQDFLINGFLPLSSSLRLLPQGCRHFKKGKANGAG